MVKYVVGIDSSYNQLLIKGVSTSVGVGVGTEGETLNTSYLFSFISYSELLTAAEAYYLQETKRIVPL